MTQQQQKPCACTECGARFNSKAELEQHEKDCQNESVEQPEPDTRQSPERERAENGEQRRKDEDQGRQRQDEGQRRHEPASGPRQK
jgi:hypothetical protein